MFQQFDPDRFWEDPIPCKICKRPILTDHATEQVHVPFDAEHGLHELNGLYHSECAKPYLGVMRALDMIARGSS